MFDIKTKLDLFYCAGKNSTSNKSEIQDKGITTALELNKEIISEFERLQKIEAYLPIINLEMNKLKRDVDEFINDYNSLKAENERLKGEVKELEVLIMGFPSQ